MSSTSISFEDHEGLTFLLEEVSEMHQRHEELEDVVNDRFDDILQRFEDITERVGQLELETHEDVVNEMRDLKGELESLQKTAGGGRGGGGRFFRGSRAQQQKGRSSATASTTTKATSKVPNWQEFHNNNKSTGKGKLRKSSNIYNEEKAPPPPRRELGRRRSSVFRRGSAVRDFEYDDDDDDEDNNNNNNNNNNRSSAIRGFFSETAPDSNDDDSKKLPHDIYSFLACTNYLTPQGRPRAAFLLTMFVFFIQVTTLVLFAIDIVDTSAPTNPLKIPPGVDNTVRFAQVIALLITAVSQDETQLSLNIWARGYDARATLRFQGKVTTFKWFFSILTRFYIGGLSLAVTFMLIIRSDTVRDLMLDFTAVSFVSQIDDGIFLLARWGYLGKIVRRQAEDIFIIPILLPKKEKSSRSGKDCWTRCRDNFRIPRIVALLAILIGLIVAWFILTIRQINGRYINQMVFVQFEDDFTESLGTFTGLYQLETVSLWQGIFQAGRDTKYVARWNNRNRTTTAATDDDDAQQQHYRPQFIYCVPERAWVFQIGQDPKSGQDLSNKPCQDSFLAKSAETLIFDLTQTAAEGQWFYRERISNQDLPLTHYVIQGMDYYYGKPCANNDDCGGTSLMYCELTVAQDGSMIDNSGGGGGGADLNLDLFFKSSDTVQNGFCACSDDRYGVTCEFVAPCQEIEIDQEANPSGFVDTRPWSFHYSSVPVRNNTPYSVYHKPIYIGDNVRDGNYDVMLFAGRRWMLLNTAFIHDMPQNNNNNNSTTTTTLTRKDVASFLSNNFHAFWSDYQPSFLSYEVDFLTFTAAATPVEKEWLKIEAYTNNGEDLTTRDTPALLLCSTCDDVNNPCFFNATCQADRTCLCTTGSTGTLCQIPPVGDAFCHDFFNSADNEYDGGDCCQTTCQSTDVTICGENITTTWSGLQTIEYIGYDHCADIDEVCSDDDSTFFVNNNNNNDDANDCWRVVYETKGEIAFSQLGLAAAISQDGSVWALVEDEAVTVLEQFGSTYRQRGEIFVFSGVVSVAISSDGNVLAIGTSDLGIDTFIWELRDRRWKQNGSVYNPEKLSSMSLSSDGTVMAVGYKTSDSESKTKEVTIGRVLVYHYNFGLLAWETWGNEINDSGAGGRDRHVSLSDNGRTLAVGFYSSGLSAAIVFPVTSSEDVLATINTNINPGRNGNSSIANMTTGSVTAPPPEPILNATDLESLDRVVVYDFDGPNWKKRGQIIGVESANATERAAGTARPVGNMERFGRWVSLSGAGDRVAIVSTVTIERESWRRVSVHEYHILEDSWIQIGGIVQEDLEAGTDAGPTLSLSNDGTVVATSSIVESAITTAFVSMYVYDETSSNWTLVNDRIDLGESNLKILPSVALSADGTVVSVGYENQFGDVLLYWNAKRVSVEESAVDTRTGLVALHFTFTLDRHPEQTGIFLNCDGSDPYGRWVPGMFFDPSVSVETTVYVVDGSECQFAITDSEGDGICCAQGKGEYEVYYEERKEENLVARGGGVTFGSLETFVFTAENPSNLIPMTVELTYVDMGSFASQVDLSVMCGEVLESRSLPGGFSNDLGNEIVTQGVISKTFFLRNQTKCTFTITKKASINDGFVSVCKTCILSYEVFQGKDDTLLEDRVILAKQEPTVYAMSPTDTVQFVVAEGQVSSIPLTVVIRPDAHLADIGYFLRCGSGLNVGFDIGFLTANNATLPSDFTYIETFYVPFGSRCGLSVLDAQNDGLCCNGGDGYYQLYYGGLLSISEENLINQGDRFDGSETTFFLATRPANDTSTLSVTVQADENPEDMAFELKCTGQFGVSVVLSHYFVQPHAKTNFIFSVQDVTKCTMEVTDLVGNGLNQGGYYEVLLESDHILYSETFNGSFAAHDLSEPQAKVAITTVVQLGTIDDTVTYELRCAGFVRTGEITSDLDDGAMMWIKTFQVLDGLECQFSLRDSGGNGLNDGGFYQVYYNDASDPSNVIVAGSYFLDTEIVIFKASPPTPDSILLGLRYQISANAVVDPTFDLECTNVPTTAVYTRELGFQSGQVVTQFFVLEAGTGDCKFRYTNCCGDLVRASYNRIPFAIIEKGAETTPLEGEFAFPGFSTEAYVAASIVIDATAYALISYTSDLLSFDSVQYFLYPGIQDIFIPTGIRTLTGTFYIEHGGLASFAAFDMFEVTISIYYGSIFDPENIFVKENLVSQFANQANAATYFYAIPEDFYAGAVDVIVDIDFDLKPYECDVELECQNGYRLPYFFSNSSYPSESLASQPFSLTYGAIPNGTECTLRIADSEGDGLQREGFEVRLGDLKEEYYNQGGYKQVVYQLTTGATSTLEYVRTDF